MSHFPSRICIHLQSKKIALHYKTIPSLDNGNFNPITVMALIIHALSAFGLARILSMQYILPQLLDITFNYYQQIPCKAVG